MQAGTSNPTVAVWVADAQDPGTKSQLLPPNEFTRLVNTDTQCSFYIWNKYRLDDESRCLRDLDHRGGDLNLADTDDSSFKVFRL